MACNILFIRHGQSIGNLNHVFLGHTNLDLSPLGYEQAMLTAKFLSKRQIDKIYTSDLLRAYNTSKPLVDNKGIKVIENKNLREIYAGEWENKSVSELKTVFQESYGVWLNNIGRANPDSGESVLELQNRIIREITEIADLNDGRTVAVFTHATPIRTFFAYVNGKKTDEIKDLPWPSNASVSEVLYDGGKFTEIFYSRDDFLYDKITKMSKGI